MLLISLCSVYFTWRSHVECCGEDLHNALSWCWKHFSWASWPTLMSTFELVFFFYVNVTITFTDVAIAVPSTTEELAKWRTSSIFLSIAVGVTFYPLLLSGLKFTTVIHTKVFLPDSCKSRLTETYWSLVKWLCPAVAICCIIALKYICVM